VRKISLLRHEGLVARGETRVPGRTTTAPPATVILVTALIVGVTAATGFRTAGASTPTVTTKTGVVTHGAIVSNAATIGWLLDCDPSHTLPDDPIVHPGQPGTSHLHNFWGNASTDADSTLASQENPANTAEADSYDGSSVKNGTSCSLSSLGGGTSGDTGSYWAPVVYADGQPVTPTAKAEFYYRAKPTFGTNFSPIPQDARLIVGTHVATSLATNPGISQSHLYWECDGNSSTHYTTPPTSCTSFLLNVVYPSCWSGGPMDHTGPMGTDNERFAYAVNGACPSGFPIKIPQLSERFKYTVPQTGMLIQLSADPWTSSTMRTGGSTMTLGLMPTYTAHADFWNTWQPAAMRYLVTNCINAQISCGTNPLVPVGP
jgi:hypothetical protein